MAPDKGAMCIRTHPLSFVTQKGVSAQDRALFTDSRKGNQIPNQLVEEGTWTPVASFVKLVSEAYCAQELGNVRSSGREHTTDSDDGYVMPFVVLPAARLSELHSPETLAGIYLKPKSFKFPSDKLRVIYGNNNIVSVDTHLTSQVVKIPLRQRTVERIFNPTKDDGRKDHRLNGEAER